MVKFNRLRNLFKLYNISLEEVAFKLGYSIKYIEQLSQSKIIPTRVIFLFKELFPMIDIDFYNNESLNVGRLVNYNKEQWIIGIEEIDTYLLYKPDDFVLVKKEELEC
jgi:transcriptional regulator with XRE-family HTH domain